MRVRRFLITRDKSVDTVLSVLLEYPIADIEEVLALASASGVEVDDAFRAVERLARSGIIEYSDDCVYLNTKLLRRALLYRLRQLALALRKLAEAEEKIRLAETVRGGDC